MKSILKITIAILSLVVLLISCREEEIIDYIQSDGTTSLSDNTGLSQIISQTSMNDGSDDNMLDKANCITLKLPLKVTINGTAITVAKQDDYDDVLDLMTGTNDVVQITFPVTIIHENFSETIVNNQAELDEHAGKCNGENIPDLDIECVDFIYPFKFSKFNTITQEIKDITVNNDSELHKFLKANFVDDSSRLDILFPIKMMIQKTKQVVEIKNYEELQKIIDDNKDTCDEEDNYDIPVKDDTCTDCDEEQVKNVFDSCPVWWASKLRRNGVDYFPTFKWYDFRFRDNGIVTAQLGLIAYGGTWSVTKEGTKTFITINIPLQPRFNGKWQLQKVKNNRGYETIYLKNGADKLNYTSSCGNIRSEDDDDNDD